MTRHRLTTSQVADHAKSADRQGHAVAGQVGKEFAAFVLAWLLVDLLPTAGWAAPVVATQAPWEITETSATLNGMVTPNGAPTMAWFEWDLGASLPCARPPAGLINWWTAEGDGIDQVSGSSGTPLAGLGFAAGKVGMAFSFDGVDDSFRMDLPSLPPPWTAEFWVNRQSGLQDSVVLLSDYDTALKLEQWPNLKKVGFTRWWRTALSTNTGDFTFNYTAPPGQWVHLVFVGTPTNTQLYVNGLWRDTVEQILRLPRGSLGRDIPGGYEKPLRGLVDEPSLYNRILTSTEIQALYHAGATGKCGSGGELAHTTPPVAVGTGHDVVRVSAAIEGLSHRQIYSCRLVVSNANGVAEGAIQRFITGGRIVAWGKPDATKTTGGRIASLGPGLALRTDGTMLGWLEGAPAMPANLAHVVAVAAGPSHGVALHRDRTVTGWGAVGVPPGLSNIIALAAGDHHTLALLVDGRVLAWGNNDDGQCTVPVGLSNVVAIAAGGSHSLALRDGGNVVAWGSNLQGQCSPLPSSPPVVAIAAGALHSLALHADGTVSSRGLDSVGNVSNVVAISAGLGRHSLTLDAHGAVQSWGADPLNALAVPTNLNHVAAVVAGWDFSSALTLPDPTILNDAFADRIPMVGSSVVLAGSNLDATKEPDEPNHAGNPGGCSVWWTWTAPASGHAALSTAGSLLDTLLAVYDGDSLHTLTLVVANDQNPDGGDDSRVSFSAEGGRSYQIAVDGYRALWTNQGPIVLNLNFNPLVNDKFSAAIPLLGSSNLVTGHNFGATDEPGEPAHGGLLSTRSVWWAWTAPETGRALVTVLGTGFPAVIAIYAGDSLPDLQPLASGHAFSDSDYASAAFEVRAGATYYLAVDSANGIAGAMQIQVGQLAPPANDLFANRLFVTHTNFSVGMDLSSAGSEPGEPPHEGQGISGAYRSAWWSWTAPQSGWVWVDLSGEMSVYTGATLSALDPVPLRPFFAWGSWRVWFAVQAGVTYQLAFYPSNSSDLYVWANLRTGAYASNDDFTDALLLDATNQTSGATIGATSEAGEPAHRGSAPEHSVWWKFKPVERANAIVRISASFAPRVAVYTRGAEANLAEVFPAEMRGNDYFRFPVSAGVDYWLAVDGENGASGQFGLNVELVPAPINDDFERRLFLTGDSVLVPGSTVDATEETGEPSQAMGFMFTDGSVWWSWTAPFTGVAAVQAWGPDTPNLVICTGTGLTSLGRVEGNNFAPEPVRFLATSGATYHIAVGRRWFSIGNEFSLELRLDPPPSHDRFANRMTLTGAVVSAQAILAQATAEQNEPPHASAPAHASVWWSWTAPSSGGVSLRTDRFRRLAVYTGEALDGLTPVDQAWDFRALAGVTYQIALDGYSGQSFADLATPVTLTLEHAPSPVNDDFSGRIDLGAGTQIVTAFSRGASREAMEPPQSQASLWWSWTAPGNGEARILWFGEEVAFANVYTGSSLATLELVASGSRYQAKSNMTYHIAIGTYGGEPKEFRFAVTLETPSPPNDDLARRLRLPGLTNSLLVSLVGATPEVGEPAHAGQPATRSLWYSWVAPADGTLVVSAMRTNESFGFIQIAAYEGDSLSGLSPKLAASTLWLPALIKSNFPVVANREYQIVVDGSYEDPSAAFVTLQVEWRPIPVNDRFQDRMVLTGATNVLQSSNGGATQDPGEGPHAGAGSAGHSVWWTWTAPQAGAVRIVMQPRQSYSGGLFNGVLSVYAGDTLAGLRPITNSWQGFVDFAVDSQQTIHLAVDGAPGPHSQGDFSLEWTLIPRPSNDSFSSRKRIERDATHQIANLYPATLEPDEPFFLADRTGGRSLWWRWTAPVSGPATVDTSLFGRVAIYTGESLATLTPIASASRKVTFTALAATEYHIQVQGGNVDFAYGELALTVGYNPLIQITSPHQDQPFLPNEPIHLRAEASDYEGALEVLSLDLNGAYAAQNTSGAIDFTAPRLNRGEHSVGAWTRDEDGFVTVAQPVRFFVGPALHFLTHATLQTLAQPDRTLSFAGQLRIRNQRTTATGPLRLRLVARAGYSYEANSGPPISIPPDRAISLIELEAPSLAPGAEALVPVAGRCPRPIEVNPFLGYGWGVIAILEEQYDGVWLPQDVDQLLTGEWPLVRIIGPGGGVIRIEPVMSGSGFYPALVSHATVSGPATLTEGSSASYWGTLGFTGTTNTLSFTNTLWTSSHFSISTNGVFQAGSVTQDSPVTLTGYYAYGGATNAATGLVTVLNLPPPVLTNATYLDGAVHWTVQGVPARKHVIEVTSRLGDPTSWQAIATNHLDAHGLWPFVTRPQTDRMPEFFRAREE